jgi:hypothetical protein
MIRAGDGRSQHSYLGIASLALAIFPRVSLTCIFWLVPLAVSRQPSRADTAAYGFGMCVLALATALCEIVALGKGMAGTLQRWCKSMLALLGVACNVPFLVVIHNQTGLARLVTMAIAFFAEPTSKVHTVQP